MSHFYAKIPSSARKTVATARGHRSTGITTQAASWAGCIEVELWHGEDGKDHFCVWQKPWAGEGCTECLADGVLGAPLND